MQLVMAHPDDEIIFGFGVLKEATSILICSNDKDNPERAWCKNRGKALEEVGKYLGVKVHHLNFNSEFYRLPTRDETLKRMAKEVLKHIQEPIFTHNPWGEYGHLDHILIHTLVSHLEIQYSDIALDLNWLPINKVIPDKYIKTVGNDLELTEKCKAIYDKWGCWTWSQPPILKANIYENR